MLLEVRTLTPDRIKTHIQALLNIASDIEGEYWTEEHFFKELPEKWVLSFALWAKTGLPVSYAILSRKGPKHAHLHHFMVSRAFRGKGLGARMIDEMERRVHETGGRFLTLKVAGGNERAINFYVRCGFVKDGQDKEYLTMKKLIK